MKKLMILILLPFGLAAVQAQDEQFPPTTPAGPPAVRTVLGDSINLGDLVIGTGAFLGAVANNTFTVQSTTGTANTLATGNPVFGATYDPNNDRVLFTTSGGAVDGADLLAIDPLTGAITTLGTITVGGTGFRIDGLAMSGTTLYGVAQFDVGTDLAGLYVIDQTTFVATFSGGLPSGGVSGIDADPTTGLIYGVDDNSASVVQIDPDGTTTVIAAYPAGYTDVDGLAANAGTLYLVPDEPQDIVPLDIATGTYGTPLTTPFTAADTFSGGAFYSGAIAGDADLSISFSSTAVEPVTIGAQFDITVMINNAGPGTATNTLATITLPGGLTFVSSACANSAGSVVTYDAGTLNNGDNANCAFTVQVSNNGNQAVTGSVTSDTTDPVPANNTGGLTIQGIALSVPAMGTLAMILMAMLLAGIAAVRLRSAHAQR